MQCTNAIPMCQCKPSAHFFKNVAPPLDACNLHLISAILIYPIYHSCQIHCYGLTNPNHSHLNTKIPRISQFLEQSDPKISQRNSLPLAVLGSFTTELGSPDPAIKNFALRHIFLQRENKQLIMLRLIS